MTGLPNALLPCKAPTARTKRERPEISLFQAVTRTRTVGFFLFSLSALLPTAVSAQSAIAGMVRDASGRIMPNVTVEAASPALIEKSRAVVANAEGCYAIVDLRPGTCTATFMAPGFKVTRRDGIDVPADTTVPLNVDMCVAPSEKSWRFRPTRRWSMSRARRTRSFRIANSWTRFPAREPSNNSPG